MASDGNESRVAAVVLLVGREGIGSWLGGLRGMMETTIMDCL